MSDAHEQPLRPVARESVDQHVRPNESARSFVLMALSAVVLSACGANNAPSTAAAGGAPATQCAGTPIKVMTIASLSGSFAVEDQDIANAATAAQSAINRDCSLGRALQVTVCDDQSTPNGALLCGTRARSEGYLALVGFAQGMGNSQQGAEVAGLPAIFTTDSTTWDHTNPLSYPNWNTQAQSIAQLAVAKALRVPSVMHVGADIPAGRLTADLMRSLAQGSGVEFKEVFFPVSTSDFTAIAAQILRAKPGALLVFTPNPSPIISSLLSQGADFKKMPIIFGQGIMTATQVAALGNKLDADYEVGQVMPAAATSNPGIAQMKAEFEAVGIAFTPQLSAKAVQEWSAVHALALALAPLKERGIDTLTSNSLLQAVVAHGKYDLPTIAPFDFQKPVQFSNPAVSKAYEGARVFSSYFRVFRFQDGVEVPIGDWQDVNDELHL